MELFTYWQAGNLSHRAVCSPAGQADIGNILNYKTSTPDLVWLPVIGLT